METGIEPEPLPPLSEAKLKEDGYIGTLVGIERGTRIGDLYSNSTTLYNMPLFDVKKLGATEEEWWDNMAEELAYSGLDYAALNCRGWLPNEAVRIDHGNPLLVKDMIAAMKRRGVEDKFKISIFDDVPASWAAARSLNLYNKYTSAVLSLDDFEGYDPDRFPEKKLQPKPTSNEQLIYPIDNLDPDDPMGCYYYIWTCNLKLAFANFYGENRENNKFLFKYKGRPVLYLWTLNGFLGQGYPGLGGTTAGFLASVACDTVLKGTNTTKYQNFYEDQINYCLGDNPDGQSFVVGYGDKSPQNPHHRTAHGSWKNALDTPETNRHILYGALVGGPNEDGSYEDDRQNYINNEVACDYNAGFTALLCKMTDAYGGTPDPDFPEPETRDREFYVETKLTETSGGVTLSFKLTNHSAWPARIEDNLSYRYYMDLSEVIDGGFQPGDVVMRIDRDQAKMYDDYTPAQVSELKHYKDNIYYVEVTYPDGRVAMPISEGQHQCELMLALIYPNYQTGWDAFNDYSNTDLLKNAGEYVISDCIPVYQNGVLISGREPDGKTPDVTTEPQKPETLPGDVNADSKVNSADLVLLIQYLLGNKSLSKTGAANADLCADKTVNGLDAAVLRQNLTGN